MIVVTVWYLRKNPILLGDADGVKSTRRMERFTAVIMSALGQDVDMVEYREINSPGYLKYPITIRVDAIHVLHETLVEKLLDELSREFSGLPGNVSVVGTQLNFARTETS